MIEKRTFNQEVNFLKYAKFKDKYRLYFPNIPDFFWKVMFYWMFFFPYLGMFLVLSIFTFVVYIGKMPENFIFYISLITIIGQSLSVWAIVTKENDFLKIHHLDYYNSGLFNSSEKNLFINKLIIYYTYPIIFTIAVPLFLDLVLRYFKGIISIYDCVIYFFVLLTMIFLIIKNAYYDLTLEVGLKHRGEFSFFAFFVLIIIKLFFVMNNWNSYQSIDFSMLLKAMKHRYLVLLTLILLISCSCLLKKYRLNKVHQDNKIISLILNHCKGIERDFFIRELLQGSILLPLIIITALFIPATIFQKNISVVLIVFFFYSHYNSHYLLNNRYFSYVKMTGYIWRGLWIVSYKLIGIQLLLVIVTTLFLNHSLATIGIYIAINSFVFILNLIISTIIYGAVISSKGTDKKKEKTIELFYTLPLILQLVYVIRSNL
ncbi:hypothetical protein RyT2_02910 [Pseudolactococcus yaeyamensis]